MDTMTSNQNTDRRDDEETQSFWKHVKQVRDDSSIAKEELPDRLKDAAADNPQLFVQLVDEMITMYEEKTSQIEQKRSSFSAVNQHGSHRFQRGHQSIDDDNMSRTSHSHSVISYDNSVQEIEVFCSNGEEDDQLSRDYSFAGIEERSFQNGKAMTLAYEPAVDAVEVSCSIEFDDNVSQISNLSYATQVADMIRNLRHKMAGNNALASEVAKEIDAVNLVHQEKRGKQESGKLDRKLNEKSHHTSSDMNKSRSTGTLRGLNLPDTDQRDDVSLLSDESIPRAPVKTSSEEVPEKRKNKKGMLRRLFQSRKRSQQKPRKDRVNSKNHDTEKFEQNERKKSADETPPQQQTCQVEMANENFTTTHSEEEKNVEDHSAAQDWVLPLRVEIAPYTASLTPSYEGQNQLDASGLVPPLENHTSSSSSSSRSDLFKQTVRTDDDGKDLVGEVAHYVRGKSDSTNDSHENHSKEDTNGEVTKEEGGIEEETLQNRYTGSPIREVPSDEIDFSEHEEEEYLRSTITVVPIDTRTNPCGHDNSGLLNDFEKEKKCLNKKSFSPRKVDEESQVITKKKVHNKFHSREASHAPQTTFFSELVPKNATKDKKMPSRLPQRNKFMPHSLDSKKRDTRGARKLPLTSHYNPSAKSRAKVSATCLQKTITTDPIKSFSPTRRPRRDALVEGTSSDGSDNLVSVLGTFDQSLGGNRNKKKLPIETSHTTKTVGSDYFHGFAEKCQTKPLNENTTRLYYKNPVPALTGPSSPSARKTPRWFRKEFLEMTEESSRNDSQPIHQFNSDGDSQEESCDSYSSYSTDDSLDYDDPATTFFNAFNNMITPLSRGPWQI